MPRWIGVLLCVWLTAASASAQSSLPATLQQAIAATEAARAAYSFRFELTDGRQTVAAHYNPRSQPHLELLSPARGALSEDLGRAYDAAATRMDGLTWCARASLEHVANLHLLREDGATAAYSYQPTRESATNDQMRMLVDHLRGELTMTKQPSDILSIRTALPEAFSPAIGMHVDQYEISQACTLAPNGRRFASEIVTNEHFSAFGRTYVAHYVRRFSQLLEVR
jgi:hypothetical protein